MSGELDPGRRSGLRHLLLLGAGPANLYVMKQLARSRPADLNISIIVTTLPALQPRLLPAWAMGELELEQCEMPLQALAHACKARVIAGPCSSLSAAERRVVLADGQKLGFDLLLLDIEAHMGRARADIQMPGARHHALFLHPWKQFAALWPRLQELARTRAIHVVVVGGSRAAFEWLMTAAAELRPPHGSRISWVSQGPLEAQFASAPMRRRVLASLAQHGITLLQANCVGFSAGEVLLDNGARLACDAQLLAGPCSTPEWLQISDLALDPSGRVLVDPSGHSQSHPAVLAVNEAASVEIGSAELLRYPDSTPRRLLRSVRDMLAGRSPATIAKPSATERSGLELLASGRGRAIASWRGLSLEGRIPWTIRQALDRRFLRDLQAG